ncbi:GNAT family N-acetyltransferase [Mucilaginibacter sp.]|uniref:GNAT family N-acetyltransferase n=1 Tax=Mucilaginibacter sp. TaxID=1882438 RepID=UPI0028494775|nr:GNAT family N-acetyltransferase [Mucilaginibacter sp.]MDR3694620.1 GNAT family N-acetyltransferase [Mucilaginibacter sp.]
MVTIRKCSNNDIPLLLDIAIRSYRETYEYLWDDKGDAYISRFYSKEILEREIAIEGIGYFLVYHGSAPAGYFKTTENALTPDENKDCLEIEKIYFLNKFKRKGIGKQAMLFIENLARVQHKSLIWLKVMESSIAIPFYHAHGFTQVKSTRLDYPQMKDEYRNILTLTKGINTNSGV